MNSIRTDQFEDFYKMREDDLKSTRSSKDNENVNQRLEDLKHKLKQAGAGQKFKPLVWENDSEDADDYYDEEDDDDKKQEDNKAIPIH